MTEESREIRNVFLVVAAAVVIGSLAVFALSYWPDQPHEPTQVINWDGSRYQRAN
jgi:hypothetical protein